MTKRILKVSLLSLAALLLAAVLCAVVVLGWYYPHYISHKQVTTVTPQGTGQIKLMSYNLRCMTPLDLGKKACFYRADLLVADIAQQVSGLILFQEATRRQHAYLTDVL